MAYRPSIVRYLEEVGKEAWSASLDVAQTVLFVALTLVGATITMFPGFAATHNFGQILSFAASWKGAAIVLGAVIVSRLLMAPYLLSVKDRNKLDILEGKLQEFSFERPLKYENCNYKFHLEEFKRGNIVLLEWSIILGNFGNSMIQYKIKETWLKNLHGEYFISRPIEHSEIYISGADKSKYRLTASDEGLQLGSSCPCEWTLGFEVEYDSVPPIKRRSFKQVRKYWLISMDPPEFEGHLVSREEL